MKMEDNVLKKKSGWDWLKLVFINGWIFFKLNERERKEILGKLKNPDIKELIRTFGSILISVILLFGIALYFWFKHFTHK